jgi:TldD protein
VSCDFAPLRDAPERADAAGGSRFALDCGLLNDLADLALQGARAGGASYADIRLGETLREYAAARDDRLEHFDERSTRGFGLRVLLDACWGFYGARRLDAASVTEGVARALENARAVAYALGHARLLLERRNRSAIAKERRSGHINKVNRGRS